MNALVLWEEGFWERIKECRGTEVALTVCLVNTNNPKTEIGVTQAYNLIPAIAEIRSRVG